MPDIVEVKALAAELNALRGAVRMIVANDGGIRQDLRRGSIRDAIYSLKRRRDFLLAQPEDIRNSYSMAECAALSLAVPILEGILEARPPRVFRLIEELHAQFAHQPPPQPHQPARDEA